MTTEAQFVHDQLLAELVQIHEQFHTIHVSALRATSDALVQKHKTADRLGVLLGVGLHQVGRWAVHIDHDAAGRWVVKATDTTEVTECR